jgi:ketosteroid isomerase-like protein
MELSERAIAEAFSGHRFEETSPFLAQDLVWRMPGSEDLVGRDAVISGCRSTAAALTDTQIEVERFVVVDGGDVVAVDTLTRYTDGDDTSSVASCDIYEYRDGVVVQITSYTVEV